METPGKASDYSRGSPDRRGMASGCYPVDFRILVNDKVMKKINAMERELEGKDKVSENGRSDRSNKVGS